MTCHSNYTKYENHDPFLVADPLGENALVAGNGGLLLSKSAPSSQKGERIMRYDEGNDEDGVGSEIQELATVFKRRS